MTPEERASLVQEATAIEWGSKRGRVLEKTRKGRKLVFYREPEFILDKSGAIVGVDAWVRLYGRDGRELRIDPHRRIINPPTVGRGRSLNPRAAFYEAVWDSVESAPNPKGWRTRGTVTTVFANTADDTISSNNAAYATARTGGTLSLLGVAGTSIPWGQQTSFLCQEAFISFDTSAIADSDVVQSVVLDLWGSLDQSDTDSISEVYDFDWGASVTTADWVSGASLGSLTMMASLTTVGWSLAGYNTFTSTANFVNAANLKTGTVHLLISSSRHRLGNQPAGNERVGAVSADQAGTTNDPKLTITHTAPNAMPFFTGRPNRIWRLG